MIRTHLFRCSIALAAVSLSACDKAAELLDGAQNGLTVSGTVKDSHGAVIEGAKIRAYAYSQNLQAFARPGEPTVGDINDPQNYKVRVDIGELLARGEPEAEIGTTGADGRFEIKDLPIVDGLILVAEKQGYSTDISGMDISDGTVSALSALKPSAGDLEAGTASVSAEFVLAGGPVPMIDGDGDGVPPGVEPVPPPPAPTPPPAPEPPAPPPPPECVVNGDCMPGQACDAGACGPECAMDEHCGTGLVCNDGACGPECGGDADCDVGEVCGQATLACEPSECDAARACDGLRTCEGGDHGRCISACDAANPCADANQICDAVAGGCRFECTFDTDCAGNAGGPLCVENHCAPAECVNHDDCLADGKNGGYCDASRCVKECGDGLDAAVCGDRNMVCDDVASRCKIECVGDLECGGNAAGPLCNANRCAPSECGADDECLADGKNGGFCVTNRCIVQCDAVSELGAVCGDSFAECPRGRCVLPDPNELHAPVTSGFSQFVMLDPADAIIADASAGSVIVDKASDAAQDGAVIRITGQLDGAMGEGTAFLRVQHGDSHCADSGYAPKVDEYKVKLLNGKVVSDKGEFQEFVLTGGYQQFQLDVNDVVGDGNESHLITVADRCDPATPPRNLIVTLTWDNDQTDLDLHVWNQDNDHTFYGSNHEGQRRQSSFAKIDIDDRFGFGPEVFELNDGIDTGTYTVRANFFSGLPNRSPANVQVRVQRKVAVGWADETFTASITRRGWVDIGIFNVGAEGHAISEAPPSDPVTQP